MGDLGMGVRKVLKDKGYTSVAAEGWEAPGVAVVYANNDPTYAGHFKNAQFQIAAGVPLVLGEPDHYNSSASACSAWTSSCTSQDDPQLRGRARRGHCGEGHVGPVPVHKQ